MRGFSGFNLRWTCLVLIITLMGCQSIQGGWYYQKEPGRESLPMGCDHKSRLCLYLNVTNNSRKKYDVVMVRVFTQLPSVLPFGARRKALWECRYRDVPDGRSRAYVWRPGQTVVLTLSHQGDAACMIPMDAELVLREREHPVRVRIIGSQPSLIPAAWLRCSRPTSDTGVSDGVIASRVDRQTVDAPTSEDEMFSDKPKNDSEEPKGIPMFFECDIVRSSLTLGGSVQRGDP